MQKKSSTLWKVLVAIGLAILVGSFSSPDSTLLGIRYIKLFAFLGQLFLNALTLLMVPLVSSSVIFGISQIGRDHSFGRLGSKTFFFYIFTTLLAVLTGLICVNLIQPGLHSAAIATSPLPEILTQAAPARSDIVGKIILKIIPVNIFEAAVQGNMLGILFFSFLFGFALAKIESNSATVISNAIKGIFATLMKMTQFIMKAMPIGVFFLVAKATAEQGPESFKPLLSFFATVTIALAIFMFLIIPLLLRLMGLNPIRHLQAMAPALITAFSTSSSTATLPITMDCVEKRAGVSNKICSFVIPLGTSVNMSGSALYELVAVFFIAQVYGIELTLVHQAMIVFLSLITSMGIAGIPSGSLLSIIIVLNAMGIPVTGLELILPVDRILDMCRTTVNVFSDSSCAVLVAHTEKEKVLKETF
ncbi:MAG: dicarboxylate/amino acid:cation symporter [Verrucomicrobia bacterium]|nr:dicarboxylate/amino acid:cation symporter [Verrucomicrobiota bacterium]